MELHQMKDIIADHPFFKGISDKHIELLAGCASNVHYEANQLIFKQRDPANEFLILRQGRIAIELQSTARGDIMIQTVDAGEVVGWSWLFPPYTWNFDARVIDPVAAIVMDGKCLRGKCEEDVALGYEMMKRFSAIMQERLQATRMQLLDIYST